MVITVAVLIVFAFAWYFPVYKTQGKEEKIPLKYYIIALFLGMLSSLVAVLISFPFAFIRNKLGLEGLNADIFNSIFLAGVCEELVKFFFGWIIIRKLRPCRKIDAVLIFGTVGLGFELLESILIIDSVVTGIFRGVQALHMMWLFWCGAYWWESRKCKAIGDNTGRRRNLLIAFIVPIVTHALNDICVFAFTSLSGNIYEGSNAVIAIVLVAIVVIGTIVFDIITEIMAIRIAKASRVEAEKI